MNKVWFDEAWEDYLYWQDREAGAIKRRAKWILEQAHR